MILILRVNAPSLCMGHLSKIRGIIGLCTFRLKNVRVEYMRRENYESD